MKSGKGASRSVIRAAVAVLERMLGLRQNDHIFPGDHKATLSNMALLMLLRRMGYGRLQCTAFDPRSATGQRSRQISRAKWRKWRWPRRQR